MSTQSLAAYNLGYDPYLAQQLDIAVKAARSGNTSGVVFPTQTATTPTSASSPTVSQETLREYERQIAEIEKLQQESQKGAIYEEDGRQYQIQSDGYVATDGKNDGKISFGQKLKNLGKGVVKTFTGMFTDKDGKFSLKQTLKSVAIAGACIAASAILPGVGSALVYAGLALGTAGLVKNGVKAAKATTDQEAEQAWQGIGTSGTVVAMSLAGIKQKGAAANAEAGITKGSGVKGAIKGFFSDMKSGFKVTNSDIASAAGKIIEGNGAYLSEVQGNVATKIFNKANWSEVKELTAKEKAQTAYTNLKDKAFEALTEKSQMKEKSVADVDRKIEALNKAKGKRGLSAEEIADIDAKIDKLNIQREMYSNIDRASAEKIKFESEAAEKE